MIEREMQQGARSQPGNVKASRREQETIFDNVQDRSAPTGNTIDAGLRRLRKAAEA
jgi:hypothetical protein